MVFIDGGHEASSVEKDLRNFALLSNTDTLLIVDDTSCSDKRAGVCDGPARAWHSFVEQGLLHETRCSDAGFCMGKFLYASS